MYHYDDETGRHFDKVKEALLKRVNILAGLESAIAEAYSKGRESAYNEMYATKAAISKELEKLKAQRPNEGQ